MNVENLVAKMTLTQVFQRSSLFPGMQALLTRYHALDIRLDLLEDKKVKDFLLPENEMKDSAIQSLLGNPGCMTLEMFGCLVYHLTDDDGSYRDMLDTSYMYLAHVMLPGGKKITISFDFFFKKSVWRYKPENFDEGFWLANSKIIYVE